VSVVPLSILIGFGVSMLNPKFFGVITDKFSGFSKKENTSFSVLEITCFFDILYFSTIIGKELLPNYTAIFNFYLLSNSQTVKIDKGPAKITGNCHRQAKQSQKGQRQFINLGIIHIFKKKVQPNHKND